MAARAVAPLLPGQHVIIAGAGPAGLTAAYLLSKQGVRTTVFEASDMVGGISQTAQYKGYRFDIGGHRFFTKIEPVQQLWTNCLATSSSACRVCPASFTAASSSTIHCAPATRSAVSVP